MLSTIESRDIQQQIAKIKEADIVIGIPSFNNARTIGHVVRAVQAGLLKYFPDSKALLVNSDGGSTDKTMEIVNQSTVEDLQSILLHHRGEPFFKIATPYLGLPGKGSAFHTIFEIAAALDAKACAVVDSDLRSITPEWVELLVKPVLSEGFDFVAPLYHRHKYDGTITNSIVYPLTRALYGKQVRQPIGGDFGFSGRLAKFFLTKNVWNTDIARYGIDIWMTTEAIANDFKIAQAFLGAKIHDAKDPGSDLSLMLSQVTGVAFSLMKEYYEIWKPIQGSYAIPTFGFQYTVGLEQVNVNVGRMLTIFRQGIRELAELWQQVLGPGDLGELESIAARPDQEFRFPLNLWMRVVFDFALAYHKQKLPVEHLLKSLTPLYLGKTASFVQEVENMGQEEAEAEIEKLCLEFEQNKALLISQWR